MALFVVTDSISVATATRRVYSVPEGKFPKLWVCCRRYLCGYAIIEIRRILDAFFWLLDQERRYSGNAGGCASVRG